MAEILNAKIVLRLNANYMRLGWSTPADAFTAMMGGTKDSPPYLALDIGYELDDNGNPKFDKMTYATPMGWDEWKNLPVRSWDSSVGTVKSAIRVPTVVICPKFKNMPKKDLKPTAANIRNRDKNVCQYSGQPLTNKTFSLDHVLPRSKGGKDTWENLVSCHKDLNSKKGNMLNHEIGYKLPKKPVAPMSIPLCNLVTDTKNPDHQWF
jgi:5-methylcytosine-specific restriction endonuclease McrA